MPPTTKPASPAPKTAVVEITDLVVQFGPAVIVEELSLQVNQGEMVAIAGANGSGKSTLIRALTGVVPHTSGSIKLFGQPQGRKTPWARIGYVPQRVSAATGVPSTAAEVVASGLLAGNRIIPGRGARARALDALELVGLRHRANQPVHELSGGQQQRVLIARALVRKPDLLILDEPVAGVDQVSQQKFARTVATLRERGATVMVVLHEYGPLAELLTRTVVLSHGQVAYDGPPRSTVSHPHPHIDPLEPVLPSHLQPPTSVPGVEL